MKSRRIIITLFIVATCFAAPFARADGLDGSRPLLCATMSAIECVEGKGCENSHPKDLDLPQFLRIDFAANQITTVRAGGDQRLAKISSISDRNPTLVLQGVQDAMGWTISISKSVGNMSAIVMDREFVAVVFGACMPEK